LCGEIIKLSPGFFAVMNPLGNIPIFISLTGGYTVKNKRNSQDESVKKSGAMCGHRIFLTVKRFCQNRNNLFFARYDTF